MQILRGQVWIADLGQPKGSEQRGKRPVLILQNDVGNKFSPTVIVAAITDSRKRFMPTHVFVSAMECGLSKDSVVLLEQVRTIDKSKLGWLTGTLPNEVMNVVDSKIKVSFGLVPVREARRDA